jgi:hypothetical protein
MKSWNSWAVRASRRTNAAISVTPAYPTIR